MVQLRFGSVDIPTTWDVRMQLELRAPAVVVEGPKTARQKSVPTPGPNIILRRGPAPKPDAVACAQDLLTQLAAAVPGLRAQPVDTTRFVDGTEGATVEVAFDTPQTTVHQRHVFRLDGPVLTHGCASAADPKALAAVLPVLLSFTPS